MIKKIITLLGIAILGLILALAIFPFVFKDRILEEVKKVANEELNAVVDFSDVDISFFKSFPKVNINIEDLSIMGVAPFDSITLLHTEGFDFAMNLTPLWDREATPVISYIGLKKPKIHVQILDSVTSNYSITKPDTSASAPYYIQLDKYDIQDGSLIYEDRSLGMIAKINKVDHNGKGAFDEAVFDLITQTTFETLNVKYDGFTYLDNVKGKFDAKINMDNNNAIYTLLDNDLILNDLQVQGDGKIQLKEDDIIINAQLTSKNTDFKNLVSVIPYLPLDKNMKVAGTFSTKCNIDGTYNSVSGSFPGFDFILKANDGSIQYPDLPYPITNIDTDMRITAKKSNWSDMVIDIAKLDLSVDNESFHSKFLINNGMADPKVNGEIIGKITLQNWKQALPLEGIESIEGVISSDIKFDAVMSDIESGAYDKIKFDGAFEGQGIKYKATDSPEIGIQTLTCEASPASLIFNSQGVKLGKSSLTMDGIIDNPLAAFSENVDVKGTININADLIDANEWISSDEGKVDDSASLDLSRYKASNIVTKGIIKKMLYDQYELDNINYAGNVGVDVVDFQKLNFTIGESDFDIVGKMTNLLDYMAGSGQVIGDIALKSKYLDADAFMQEENASTQAAATSDVTTFEVPNNVSLTLDTRIDKMKYTGYEITGLQGKTTVNQQAMLMEGYKGNIIGGSVAFDGLYDSKETQPTFDMKIDMSQMKFNKAYETFVSIKALAPIIQYIEGFFNTTLVFEGKLNAGMVPDFSSLNASGYIETLNSTIKNAEPLTALGNKLNISELKSLKLENTKNWFEVVNGTVSLKERDFTFGDITSTIKGSHKISGDMNYEAKMSIPRSLLEKSKVTSVANKGLDLLTQEARKIGVNIDQGAYINLKVNIGGRLLQPTIKITPLGASGEPVKDELNAAVDQVVEVVKDSVQKVVNQKKKEVEDSLRNVAQRELDKAKDKAIKEGEKILDKAKDEIKEQVKSKIDSAIVNKATDSLANKAKDILEKNTGTKVEDIKDKIKDWNPLKKKKGGG